MVRPPALNPLLTSTYDRSAQNKSHFSVYSRPVLWYNVPYESLHNLPEVPTATWNGPDAQARE